MLIMTYLKDDNDKLGEELEILRDNDNTVIGYKTHQNIYKRSR